VLTQWRARAVTVLLYVISIAALPTVLTGVSLGTDRVQTALMLLVYASIVVNAVCKKLPYQLRGSVLLLAGYVMAINSLAPFGLEGSGRSYLIVMPIIAFILVGIRAGWVATAASILLYGAFILFVRSGILTTWLIPQSERVSLNMWITTGLTAVMLLVIVVALFMSMYRFLLAALKAEQKASAELVQTYDATLEGWAHALELRDLETAGHCHRVCEVATSLAGKAGMASDGVRDLYRGSLLHDIGKMGVPDSILLKPGKLTEDESRRMQRHTTYAYELLVHIPFLLKALDIPYCHHEKWDGTGYPRGLKGREIPLSARIFSVVDVYDALTSDRCYRRAWPPDEALAHIKERAGTEFDPDVVAAFLRMIEAQSPLSVGSVAVGASRPTTAGS